MLLLWPIVSVVVAMTLSAPAWIYSKREGYFLNWEIAVPFGSYLLWTVASFIWVYILVFTKSPLNIAEAVLFLPAINVLSAYLKAFALRIWIPNPQKAALTYLAVNFLGAILLCIFIPYLPIP